jgi:hypothetical protein
LYKKLSNKLFYEIEARAVKNKSAYRRGAAGAASRKTFPQETLKLCQVFAINLGLSGGGCCWMTKQLFILTFLIYKFVFAFPT